MAENELDKKIKLDFEAIKYESFNFGTKKIVVKTLLDKDDKIFIYSNYINMFFYNDGSAPERFLSAKYSFMLSIIGLCTNIDPKELDIDLLIDSGIWASIVKQIKNYDQVKKDLYALTKMMSEERLARQSIGSVIDNLYEIIVSFIQNLDVDKLNENATNLAAEFKSGIKKLEDSGVVLPESIRQKKDEE
jgi:hypothetical protein